jgi:hypothetical protein
VNPTNLQKHENPPGFDINFDRLAEFEGDLDPQSPEKCRIGCHVLGYGEISTVFEIKDKSMEGLAFKRMSIFETQEELDKYISAYMEYNRLLEQEIGLGLPPRGHAMLTNPTGRPVFYIIQGKLPSHSIGNNAIHLLNRQGVTTLFERILHELHKVWDFNHRQSIFKVSIDGQISNWVIEDFDPGATLFSEDASLSYIDTSTPVYLHNGVEQFDPELVIRTTPRLLAMVIRLFFLEDVMARYYDPRQVAIDILANFYKDQRADLIPDLVSSVNRFFDNGGKAFDIEPIDEKEISDYYREDALIWSFLSASRRFDRFLYLKILRREYPYILPGKVER